MAGYCGYSKSNNAVAAEREGKFPKSKWTKSMILAKLSQQMETDSIKYISLSKKPLAYLKYLCLESNEWHHTSSWYLTTDYYEVQDMSDWSTEAIEESYQNWSKYMDQQKAEKKAEAEKKPSQYECEFLVWSGSRNHPKATAYIEIGEIKGSWFYSSYGKKSINANGFKIIREITK